MGVAVQLEARHMCMCMRGVQSRDALTSTYAFRGAFREDRMRSRFLDEVRGGRRGVGSWVARMLPWHARCFFVMVLKAKRMLELVVAERNRPR